MGLANATPLLEARIDAYELLRRTFIEEPSSLFIKLLTEHEIITSFPFSKENNLIQEGVLQVQKYLESEYMSDEESHENLHWDFTSLFIGPHKLPAPPWESAYLNRDRLLFQEETLKVRRVYLKHLFLPKYYGLEADDHIGLELDFMYQLSELALKNYSNKDMGGFGEVLDDQISFLQDHLIKWISAFCKDIYENASTNFYRGMSKILRGFLELDLVALKELQNNAVEVS